MNKSVRSTIIVTLFFIVGTNTHGMTTSSISSTTVPSKTSKESKAGNQTRSKRALSADEGWTLVASGKHLETKRLCKIFYSILDQCYYIADQKTEIIVAATEDEKKALALLDQPIKSIKKKRSSTKKDESKQQDTGDRSSFDDDELLFAIDDLKIDKTTPTDNTPKSTSSVSSTSSSDSSTTDPDTLFS